MEPAEPTLEDRAIVAAQLRRPPRGAWTVAARCHLGLPTVIEAAPLLEDGTPFPTLYWLTCPLANRRVSRVEHAGRVRELTARLAAEPELAAAYERSMALYAARRAARIPPDLDPALAARIKGGVAGKTRPGVKCLHAHDANRRAGGPDPIGDLIAPDVDPLDCAAPCFRPDGAPNPGWSEPSHPVSGPQAGRAD